MEVYTEFNVCTDQLLYIGIFFYMYTMFHLGGKYGYADYAQTDRKSKLIGVVLRECLFSYLSDSIIKKGNTAQTACKKGFVFSALKNNRFIKLVLTDGSDYCINLQTCCC